MNDFTLPGMLVLTLLGPGFFEPFQGRGVIFARGP